MKKHICRQCQKTYEYCRGCLVSPILYKEIGFCSKECYEASKNKVEPIVEEVIETILVEDIVPTEEVSVEVEAEPIIEEEPSIDTETPTENAVAETITVVEPTVKKETYNTYKKKKNKYKVHE